MKNSGTKVLRNIEHEFIDVDISSFMRASIISILKKRPITTKVTKYIVY